MNEIQLILAEKRTSLSVLRTGITILALPLSIVSLLIATSKYYDVFRVLYFFIPLMVLNTILVFLGGYLIIRSFRRLHHHDRMILQIQKDHSCIAEFID